ncbi:MAG: response regulator [Bdellovibrionota bacterium]
MFSLETRILIIDDMPSIRDLVKNHLKALGYKNIAEASDGEEALKYLIQQSTQGYPVELVISDWNMPKMKGIDLLKQVRATDDFKYLPFILLTSESERDQVTEAVLAGVSQYIVKPFSSKVFQEKIKTVWAKFIKDKMESGQT